MKSRALGTLASGQASPCVWFKVSCDLPGRTSDRRLAHPQAEVVVRFNPENIAFASSAQGLFDIFIDAVTVERNGKAPREVKLGTFKLAGLTELEFAGRPFQPEPAFNPKDPKYVGATLFAVEMV